MATPLLTIDPLRPHPRHIERAVALLNAGGVIAYPTDTHYALGCDLLSKPALERLYQLKQRPKGQPVTFLCPDVSELARYAKISNAAYATLRRCTPGAYTFVLEATSLVPKIAVTRQKTVGIRIPDHPVTRALLQALGRPLASTTASGPDGQALLDGAEIRDLFGHGLAAILEAGPLDDAGPSTIVDLSGDAAVVLREGKGDVSRI